MEYTLWHLHDDAGANRSDNFYCMSLYDGKESSGLLAMHAKVSFALQDIPPFPCPPPSIFSHIILPLGL